MKYHFNFRYNFIIFYDSNIIISFQCSIRFVHSLHLDKMAELLSWENVASAKRNRLLLSHCAIGRADIMIFYKI